MHEILINIVLVVFILYLLSYILSSFTFVARKFWKKISFTSLELAWFIFLIGTFVPFQINGVTGIPAILVFLIFLVVNLSWFVILVFHYEMRVNERLTSTFYALLGLDILAVIVALLGYLGFFAIDIWQSVTGLMRGILMGLSLIYCGYLVNKSNLPQSQAKKYEFLSLFAIGTGQFIHGIFHIFVRTFDVLHGFEDIAAAQESVEVYIVLILEFIVFAMVAFGFSLFLINTIKNSDYRPEIKSKGIEAVA